MSETAAEIRIVTLSVIANSRNNRPTISPMNRRGINTAISDTVSERMVKPICSAPLSAACSGGSPASMKRAMFSIMTIASSTTNPVEIVSAIRVRLFRLYPSRYIAPNVPTRDRGTATLGITVAESVRRKRKMTITTSATVSINSNCTSSTEARIVIVRSVSVATSIDEGREARSCGSSLFTRSTTSMMFAPGCLWMFRMTAGASFIHAACLMFSAESITVATSDSVTGAPFR